MKLSIITPSFNQKAYVNSMLESVKSQSSLPFEHLIYDGGSSDGTIDILKDYVIENSYARLEIGKDYGQTNAINLGFSAASGDVLTWLNTDDSYFDEEVIQDVLSFFEAHPEVDIVYGCGDFVSEEGKYLRAAYINKESSDLKNRFITSVGVLQPAAFLRKSVFADIGPLDETMDFSFDYEYWVRALFFGKIFQYIDRKICVATIHADAKTMRSREASLRDCAAVCNKYYGFVALEWVDRLAACEISGADGIINIASKRNSSHAQYSKNLFLKFNSTKKNIENIFGVSHLGEASKTVDAIKEQYCIFTKRCIVSTFDSHYFRQGLTMISGVQKYHSSSIPIIVYDLGVTIPQRQFLSALENVYIVDFPKDDFPFFEDYFDQKSYGYKCFAMWHIKHISNKGDFVLWIDAGVCPTKALDPIFHKIEQEQVFFIDHDDKSNTPILNINCTSNECCVALRADNKELIGTHLRSSLMGYRINGKYDSLFEEAFNYSLDPEAVLGDKHPSSQMKKLALANGEKVIKDPACANSMTFDELRGTFPYFGHRQDQSIFSILAARHNAPLSSARRYCISCNDSSTASKKNWESGSVSKQIKTSYEMPSFYIKNPSITIQHRGIYINYRGLKYGSEPRLSRAIILGNGPSLRGFDFSRLQDFDVFGMNAAYRYWDEIKWYPKYYSCLDEVVGISHANEIQRLIENSDEYEIELFLLRDNLSKKFNEITQSDKIINFDILREGEKLFSSEPVTTGSHTAAWAAILGYGEIYLLGIDCNYRETIPGAEKGQGTELIISEEHDNPNYFFDGYQKKGDKYNIPNPSKDLHIRSWRNVADLIAQTDSIVLNANPQSRVDAFDFCLFDDINVCRQLHAKLARDNMGNRNVIGGYQRSQNANLDETRLVAKLYKKRCNDKCVMIDVGAHYGSSLTPFRKLGWRILAFEPDPENRKYLEDKYGKAKNIVIDPRAVGEKAEAGIEFYASEESTGISSMLAFRESHKVVATVDVTTITDIVADNNIEHVDFLKIDVEGYDYSVLKGVPWDQIKPDVIECEFEDAKTKHLGHTWRDICEYLVEKGYTVYVSEWHPIIRYGIRHDWRCLKRYPCELDDPNAWGNLLAFKNDPGDEAMQEALNKVLKVERPEKIISAPESQDTPKPIKKANPLVKEVKQPIPGSSDTKRGRKPIMKRRILPRFSSYAEFAEWVQSRNLTLFRMGQFTMRVLRFLKRHPTASAVGLAILLVLFFTPVFVSQMTPYASYFWIAAGLLILSAITIMGVSFGNKKMMEFAEREHRYRQALRAEMLRELQKRRDQLMAQVEAQGQQQTELGDRLTTQSRKQTELGDRLTTQSRKQDEFTAVVDELRKQTEVIAHSQGDLSARVEAQGKQQAEYQKTLDRKYNRLVASAPVFNFGDYQSFNRRLAKAHVDVLQQEWSRKLSVKMTPKSLAYLAHRICMLENASRGRLATTIEDAVLRVLVASAVKDKNLRVLEIGTLFGIGLAAIHDHTRSRFSSVHLTAIDPLDGYYGKDVRDIVTDETIDEQTFRANLAAAGIPEQDYTLIKSMSTEDSAVESAAKSLHDVLIIDGDHSYAGVKADFINYLPAVKRGGYIIFDDYDAQDWPDIKEFVDTTVRDYPDVALVGTSWRTAVFRVVRKSATKQPESANNSISNEKRSGTRQG